MKLRRMKDFTDEERKEIKEHLDIEIKKAHLNSNWWTDKILEIEERYQSTRSEPYEEKKWLT